MKTLATLSKEDAELEARRMLRKQIADAQEKLNDLGKQHRTYRLRKDHNTANRTAMRMDNLAERIAELTEAYDNVGK